MNKYKLLRPENDIFHFVVPNNFFLSIDRRNRIITIIHNEGTSVFSYTDFTMKYRCFFVMNKSQISKLETSSESSSSTLTTNLALVATRSSPSVISDSLMLFRSISNTYSLRKRNDARFGLLTQIQMPSKVWSKLREQLIIFFDYGLLITDNSTIHPFRTPYNVYCDLQSSSGELFLYNTKTKEFNKIDDYLLKHNVISIKINNQSIYVFSTPQSNKTIVCEKDKVFCFMEAQTFDALLFRLELMRLKRYTSYVPLDRWHKASYIIKYQDLEIPKDQENRLV